MFIMSVKWMSCLSVGEDQKKRDGRMDELCEGYDLKEMTDKMSNTYGSMEKEMLLAPHYELG